ncbi:MAG: zinc ribbon domain-containing protein [Lachnospiraceae bacterium]|nr:zinc ribbon domain-containing protein [Lachnospiraceae bacterium]
MIQCSNCGRMLEDGCRFCPYCGSPVLIHNNMKPATDKKTTYIILFTLITTFLFVISFILGVLLFFVLNWLRRNRSWPPLSYMNFLLLDLQTGESCSEKQKMA